MEGDFIFRSSTINPTVDPNYIEKKWEELVGKLNSLGKGPVLSVETWQKVCYSIASISVKNIC